jgi:hypothetical protein
MIVSHITFCVSADPVGTSATGHTHCYLYLWSQYTHLIYTQSLLLISSKSSHYIPNNDFILTFIKLFNIPEKWLVIKPQSPFL